MIDNLEVIDELLHHGEEPEIVRSRTCHAHRLQILAALQRLDKNRQAVIQVCAQAVITKQRPRRSFGIYMQWHLTLPGIK